MKKYNQVVLLLTAMLLFSSLQMTLIQAQIQKGVDLKITTDEKVDEMFTSWDSKKTPGVGRLAPG